VSVSVLWQRKPFAPLAAALVLAFGLSACSPASEEAAPAAAPATATAVDAAAANATEQTTNALAALSVVELREKANSALREQRLYGPTGDNAMEYYLAVREKSATPDVSAESALMDLMPYALIASEQAINSSDFVEAERLLALMNRTDAEAPSLTRIGDAIAAGRTAAADRERLDTERTERERVAAEQRARDDATATAAQVAAPAPAIEAPAPAPAAAPAPVQPAAVQPAPVAAAPAPVAAPTTAPARTGAPRAISTPQPPYPREAARSRTSGSVTVQYTIGADGRVTSVNVLRARPRGVFERTVEDTVKTWRFEAPGEAINQTRTFEFRM